MSSLFDLKSTCKRLINQFIISLVFLITLIFDGLCDDDMHSSCPSYQMPFLSHGQPFCGLSGPLSFAHAQFHRTRSVSRYFCTRSLALNTIKPEVSLVFVQPPQQLPLTLTHARVSEEKAIITGLCTIPPKLIFYV